MLGVRDQALLLQTRILTSFCSFVHKSKLHRKILLGVSDQSSPQTRIMTSGPFACDLTESSLLYMMIAT